MGIFRINQSFIVSKQASTPKRNLFGRNPCLLLAGTEPAMIRVCDKHASRADPFVGYIIYHLVHLDILTSLR